MQQLRKGDADGEKRERETRQRREQKIESREQERRELSAEKREKGERVNDRERGSLVIEI